MLNVTRPVTLVSDESYDDVTIYEANLLEGGEIYEDFGMDVMMCDDGVLFGDGEEEIYESFGDWGEEPEEVRLVAADNLRTLYPLHSGNP